MILYIDNYLYMAYLRGVSTVEEATMTLLSLLIDVTGKVAATFAHTWPYLLVGIVGAAALKVCLGTGTIAGWLRRRRGVAVAGAVGAAVGTPLCSCGTTAVVLSMLASTVPWAPVVAFMVASPLSSPSELLYSAGLFGWPFALVLFGGSIALGLAAGAVTTLLERFGWLRDQARFPAPACTASACTAGPAVSLGPGAASVAELPPSRVARWRLRELGRELLAVARRTLPLFFGFAALGYLVTALVPQAWIASFVGGRSPLATVLAATLGIPFSLNSEGSLPLVASLMHGGMGTGPAMAFLVTGAGTSLGAISGGLLIARWRILAIVVGTLWAGAIVLGLATATAGIG
jgi:uncharacterized membrane protein YraQ (UPF0718 family)